MFTSVLGLLGLGLASQSMATGAAHSLASSLEFAFSLLLSAYLLVFLCLNAATSTTSTGGKRLTLLPRRITPPLAIRSLLLCVCTTVWAYSFSHLNHHHYFPASPLVWLELVVVQGGLLLLRSTGGGGMASERVRQIAGVALGVLALVLVAKRAWFALLCCLSAGVRELFHLHRDAHVLLLGGAMALALWFGVLLLSSSPPPLHHASHHGSHAAAARDRVRFPLVLAGAVLWILLPKLMPPPPKPKSTSSHLRRREWLVSLGFAATYELTLHLLAAPPSASSFSSLAWQVAACAAYCVALSRVMPSSSSSLSLLPTTTTTTTTATTEDGKPPPPPPALVLAAVAGVWRGMTQDSKRIAMFLSLTLSFMLVELVMGLYTNSLGLISDAGHMFFDSAALFIGLVASLVASRKRPDAYYTFGYDRLQLVAGFVNAIFLTFVSVFVLSESLERFTAPPEVKTDGLLLTSVLGLVINGVGLVFFHDHAHGGGGGGEECQHHHGHSHGNENMQGVFLHVLADALGSVGVILSSLLIQYKQWYVADPICSFLVSLLIFASVIPLLKSTTSSLLLRTPTESETKFASLVERLKRRSGVHRVAQAHLWRYSQHSLVCTLSVVVTAEGTSSRQDVYAWVTHALREEIGCTDVTVQIEALEG